MVVLDADGTLGPDDLPEDAGPAALLGGVSGGASADGGPDRLVGRPLAEVERYYTERALALAGGKRDVAAAMLGIGERTLYRNLQKWKTEDDEKTAGN
jgi:two-component system response regulator HydG